MKSRVITGVVGSVLALVVLLLLPPVALNIAVAVVCGLAMNEMLIVTHFVGHRGLMASGVIFSVAAPFLLLFNEWAGSSMPALAVMFVYVMTLVVIQIKYHDTLPVERTGFVFFVSIILPVALSCLAYLRTFSLSGRQSDGLFYVFLTIILPWLCDIGAYFVGTFVGKHKLCPTISPKKTVEGLVGGFVVSVLASVLAGWLYQLYLTSQGIAAVVSLWQIALVALLLAPLSVAGDLFASIIKRQCHVKDFGSIMPGHGGVMDRFDSILFVAPVMFILVHYLPLISG